MVCWCFSNDFGVASNGFGWFLSVLGCRVVGNVIFGDDVDVWW